MDQVDSMNNVMNPNNDVGLAEPEDDNYKIKREILDSPTGGEQDVANKRPKLEVSDGGDAVLIPPSKVGVSNINDNDVLSGRGGGTNLHPGNRQFRDLINHYRRDYLKARKNDKPSISRAIVNQIRDKGGRFLKKDDKSGLWFEIGDDAAREKTSQALRQRAPEMRKLLLDHEMDARTQQQQMMMVPPFMFNPMMAVPNAGQNGGGAAPGMPPMAGFNPNMPFNPAMFNPALMGMPGMMGGMMPMQPMTPQQQQSNSQQQDQRGQEQQQQMMDGQQQQQMNHQQQQEQPMMQQPQMEQGQMGQQQQQQPPMMQGMQMPQPMGSPAGQQQQQAPAVDAAV